MRIFAIEFCEEYEAIKFMEEYVKAKKDFCKFEDKGIRDAEKRTKKNLKKAQKELEQIRKNLQNPIYEVSDEETDDDADVTSAT